MAWRVFIKEGGNRCWVFNPQGSCMYFDSGKLIEPLSSITVDECVKYCVELHDNLKDAWIKLAAGG